MISQLKRVNIFYLIGGLLNNAFAGVYAVIIWVIVQQHINTDNVSYLSLNHLFYLIIFHQKVSIFQGCVEQCEGLIVCFFSFNCFQLDSVITIVLSIPVIRFVPLIFHDI